MAVTVEPITLHNNLSALADRFGSDKGRVAGVGHRYTMIYDLIFSDYRDQAIHLLEIGLAAGGPEVGNDAERRVDSPSVQMWLQYFPRAHITGFDVSNFAHLEAPRFSFLRGDCGNTADLEAVARRGPFDIIIDDASHASYHQQLCFAVLFPRLAPGGLYVIEDLQWQSPFFEDRLPAVPKTWDLMTNHVECGSGPESVALPSASLRAMTAELESFAAFRDFTAVSQNPKLLVFRKRRR